MALEQYVSLMTPKIEDELKLSIDRARTDGMQDFYHMLAYQLGWEGQGAGASARGKRIRPILLLLVNAAAGGDWEAALPAAAAVELIHNFSLIHDDIQDNSDIRRGRPTIWKLWGVPQAINIGDAMFTLSHLAVLRLEETISSMVAYRVAGILQETCLDLTKGQYLDMLYQDRTDLTQDHYWQMVDGKTAALLAACTHAGALTAGVDAKVQGFYNEFGRSLGLAFQAHDDMLGIWGNQALTGKSTNSDLLTGKKSLPVLIGLELGGRFAERWLNSPIQPDEVIQVANQLELEGARHLTQEYTERLTRQALQALSNAEPSQIAEDALVELSYKLLHRSS